MRIYIVERIDGWGGATELGYFLKFERAYTALETFVREQMHDTRENRVSKYDLDPGKKNGKIEYLPERKRGPFRKNVLYVAAVFEWCKTSYEYEEYDIGGVDYRLKVVNAT
ncbi:hypothetical protein [Bradyrhizobium elkanii]|uniref:hypothetical protein n=1 Tax=Bradyrhizobium elkanii TaxID=29448 RepID=UPI003D1D2956